MPQWDLVSARARLLGLVAAATLVLALYIPQGFRGVQVRLVAWPLDLLLGPISTCSNGVSDNPGAVSVQSAIVIPAIVYLGAIVFRTVAVLTSSLASLVTPRDW